MSHLDVQVTANATACAKSTAFGEATSVLEFTTPKFELGRGAHNITITWSLRWYAQVIASGGSPRPAGATYILGVDGSGICTRVSGVTRCTVFPNSSAPGSSNSVGWHNGTTVSNGTHGHLGSATITLSLNSSSLVRAKVWIYTRIFASVDAKAVGGSAYAHAIVLFNPILGGYVKLVSISVT